MKRTFCDICERQINSENKGVDGKDGCHIKINLDGHAFTYLRIDQVSDVYPLKDICRYCLFDAIYKADDRK